MELKGEIVSLDELDRMGTILPSIIQRDPNTLKIWKEYIQQQHAMFAATANTGEPLSEEMRCYLDLEIRLLADSIPVIDQVIAAVAEEPGASS